MNKFTTGEQLLTRTYFLKEENANTATVSCDSVRVAQLKRLEKGEARLLSNDGKSFRISNVVNGHVRPFSLQIIDEESDKAALTVKDHLFSCGGTIFMIGNVPESRTYRDTLSGPKYIAELPNFPFSDLDEVDPETKNRLRRHRGIQVGEMSGIGEYGHIVKLEGKLEGIGLLVSVACCILYTTAKKTRSFQRIPN